MVSFEFCIRIRLKRSELVRIVKVPSSVWAS
jgi:hypothetical protein